MSISRSFAACAILGVVISSAGTGHAAFTEDFQSLASDPVWQNPDNGWQFLSDTSGNGTINNSITGTVQNGGPGGKYGQFDAANNGNAVSHSNPDPIVGTYSFLALFNDNPNADAIAQNRFWLGGQPGVADGNDQRPLIYLNKSGTAGKLRLQLNRGGGNGYVDDSSMNLGQWYRYTFTYDLNADIWDLAITDLSNAVVFSEAGSYDPNIASQSSYSNATWERRYGSTGSLDGPDLVWNIDQINLPVPEPTSAAVLALGILAMHRRRK